METRRIVDEHIRFKIGLMPSEHYKNPYTWKDLMETKDLLPTDIIYSFDYKEEEAAGWGIGYPDEEDRTYFYPCIVVIRKRPETDEEFLARKQKDELCKFKTEEQEKLEYLRLKAKFEKPEISQ